MSKEITIKQVVAKLDTLQHRAKSTKYPDWLQKEISAMLAKIDKDLDFAIKFQPSPHLQERLDRLDAMLEVVSKRLDNAPTRDMFGEWGRLGLAKKVLGKANDR